MELLSILLLILKIIGITLLIILGVILLVICLILFSPIKYYVDVKYAGKPDVRVKVTYLFRLLRIFFEYGTESRLTVKVLCFSLRLGDKSKKEKNTTSKKSRKKKAEKTSDDFEDDLLDDIDENPDSEEKADSSDSSKDTVSEQINTEEVQEDKEASDETGSESDNNSPKKQKAKKSKKKSKSSRKKTGKTTGDDGIIEKIKSIITLIKENKQVIAFVWSHIKKLFKHVLPGSHVINLKLGLDDPATLGEILGAVSVVKAGTNLQINITPDFENKVIEADCHFKGKIRIFSLILIALKVYFNKDVKKIINKLKA